MPPSQRPQRPRLLNAVSFSPLGLPSQAAAQAAELGDYIQPQAGECMSRKCVEMVPARAPREMKRVASLHVVCAEELVDAARRVHVSRSPAHCQDPNPGALQAKSGSGGGSLDSRKRA